MTDIEQATVPVHSVGLAERYAAAMMPTYGIPPIALASGEGVTVWDVDGKRYLDFIAGIAVSSLGHGHPALVEAVTRQAAAIAHTSNLFFSEPTVTLAETLLRHLGLDGRVFFTSSGTEANEAAFKLVLRNAAGTGKSYVVATENGFHGRSLGALALTGKASIREPFGPFGWDVRFVPYGDAVALQEAIGDGCAGVFLEPTQGEAGVVAPPDGYLAAARHACDEHGAVLVLDEIQSGIGRTGHWFAHQAEAVRPDVLTLAKGLGGGLPIGACVGVGDYGTVFGKGEHGSTFGGNPIAASAALAVLDTIEKESLLAHVADVGVRLADGIAGIEHPLLAGVRGRGLWLAAALTEPRAAAVQDAAREVGFLVNAVQPDAIRIAPPLVVSKEQVDSLVTVLPSVLDEALG